jgi:HEAT repeat protein
VALGLLLLLPLRTWADIAVAAPVFHAGLESARQAAALDQSLVLIVFGADWCAPCRQLKAKTLSAREFMEQGGALHVAEIDVDSEGSTAREYSVEAVPTLILQTADNKIVARREGFLETAELLLWLREARDRVKAGKWEGTAPGSKLSELLAKAAADQLDTNDLTRLVGMLGEPNPADREAVVKLLVEQREEAVLPLLEALTNSYLGVRIAASEALNQLTAKTASLDPWQAPADLSGTVADLKKWWAATKELPVRHAEPPVDRTTQNSIDAAVDSLRGTHPLARTEAMSTLVACGQAALPAVREAIRKTEQAGDQRSQTLLEDVRWAILVPDEVEQHAGGIRGVLARGKGSERQSAAARLAQAGRLAFPALAELLNDSDPLVVESAVRALSNIGGKDAVPALAALLKAADSNLRMTAAQALGHTRNPAAIPELLAVCDDPNEVVACAALSALDEVKSEPGHFRSGPKGSEPPEVVQTLKRCLGEPRWRVRAAAAAVAGNLAVSDLVGDLNALLNDPDAFVVKTALEALQKLSAAPEPGKLLAVAQQHPDLRAQAVESLVTSGTEEEIKAVTDLYHSSTVEGRLAIVQSLGQNSPGNREATPWQNLLAEAAKEADPRLRRATAQILAAQPPKTAAALVDNLLSDEDDETRAAAAGVVLSVIGRERQFVRTSHGTRFEEFLVADESENLSDPTRKKSVATNEPPATAAQLSAWHKALQSRAPGKDPLSAVALYVTGSTNTDLPALEQAVRQTDKAGLDRMSHSAALAALIPRLPWPGGKPIVERLCASPALFLKLIAGARQAPPGFKDYVFEPQRFRAAVEPASAEELEAALGRLLGYQRQEWTLLSSDPRTGPVVQALLDATNAAWRAAAVFSLGVRDDPQTQGALEHALTDTNSWVRAAAITSLARRLKDHAALQLLLAPLLGDANKRVAELAAQGLLEPETRSVAGLDYAWNSFEFDKIHVWSGSGEPGGEQRPLAILEGNPPFLEVVRRRLANSSPEEAGLPVLLLAQYGDFTGLEKFLQAINPENQEELQGAALTAIGLSHDTKYLLYIKKMVVSAKEEQDYRRLLQALRGMGGPEARELRVEINKRLRK